MFIFRGARTCQLLKAWARAKKSRRFSGLHFFPLKPVDSVRIRTKEVCKGSLGNDHSMKSGDVYPMTLACWRLHQLALSPEQAEPSMMISSAKVRCGNTDRSCFNLFSTREAGLFVNRSFSMTHYKTRWIGHVFENRLAK